MELEKRKYYRITLSDGDKFKGVFEEETKRLGQDCLRFVFDHWCVAVDLIKKIEEITVIKPSHTPEYLKYGTINGKQVREKYNYNKVWQK